jgi:hypothetical protein
MDFFINQNNICMLESKKNIIAKKIPSCGNTFSAKFVADLLAKIRFLENFLRIVAGKFYANLFSFSAEHSAGKFPEDSKNRRKLLPTKVLAGNENP